MPTITGTDSDFNFASGRPGNSRARPGFMRPSARMLPLDFLTFFNLHNRDQVFALTIQRIVDVLTGIIATRVSPRGGLVLTRNAANTPPVLASLISGTLHRGRVIWVQSTDPTVSPGIASVNGGDIWVQ
jgi:hypothetical protein